MEELRRQAVHYGVSLDQAQLEQLATYGQMLQEWNQRLNLTAIDDTAGIQVRHFLDALTCVAATGDLSEQRLIDVGTGAGFPGLPLKIAFPELELTLVESVSKKTRFLEAVVAALQLSGVLILDERAETLGQQKAHREQYDWAVARAVAALPTLLEYLLPFCRLGGHVLAQKGESARGEAEEAAVALAALGGGSPHFYRVELPGHEEGYYLVVIEKVAPTPDKYPRRPGRPAKRPL